MQLTVLEKMIQDLQVVKLEASTAREHFTKVDDPELSKGFNELFNLLEFAREILADAHGKRQDLEEQIRRIGYGRKTT